MTFTWFTFWWIPRTRGVWLFERRLVNFGGLDFGFDLNFKGNLPWACDSSNLITHLLGNSALRLGFWGLPPTPREECTKPINKNKRIEIAMLWELIYVFHESIIFDTCYVRCGRIEHKITSGIINNFLAYLSFKDRWIIIVREIYVSYIIQCVKSMSQYLSWLKCMRLETDHIWISKTKNVIWWRIKIW